jgi:hypothetical protein
MIRNHRPARGATTMVLRVPPRAAARPPAAADLPAAQKLALFRLGALVRERFACPKPGGGVR